ncbi:phosphoglycerate kinase [Streptomyces polygonati]|uniref:Phosphoglycerate kinase n=1 Tax=Streptomyces polygonati TaxID=1617087 RepID=A0ABV8HWX1_9ACTN
MRSDDPLAGVPLLDEAAVAPDSRWIFSAGFNTGPDLGDTGRVDAELADLRRLSDAGARVALLSHQGSSRDGTAIELDHVARYLSRRLGRPVGYHPGAVGGSALRAAGLMRAGDIVLFGNTRLLPGEEDGDLALARQLARLGDQVAVGGFSKAHRAHASNCGLLRHLPGHAADSLVREIRFLAPWAGRPPGGFSAAVLGGSKPEKTLIGLRHFSRAYDLVIPGGVVLNTVLRALGHGIGRSALGSRPDACARAAEAVLAAEGGATLHVPGTVLVVRAGERRAFPVRVTDGVPADCAIVDFVIRPWAVDLLRGAARAVVAGPPSLCRDGHTEASYTVLSALEGGNGSALLLGGDTVRELPWSGLSSTGGGSALEFLSENTCAVLDELRANRLTTAHRTGGARPSLYPPTDRSTE